MKDYCNNDNCNEYLEDGFCPVCEPACQCCGTQENVDDNLKVCNTCYDIYLTVYNILNF